MLMGPYDVAVFTRRFDGLVKIVGRFSFISVMTMLNYVDLVLHATKSMYYGN